MIIIIKNLLALFRLHILWRIVGLVYICINVCLAKSFETEKSETYEHTGLHFHKSLGSTESAVCTWSSHLSCRQSYSWSCDKKRDRINPDSRKWSGSSDTKSQLTPALTSKLCLLRSMFRSTDPHQNQIQTFRQKIVCVKSDDVTEKWGFFLV